MNRGCCVGRYEAATCAFHQGLQMRRRDRPHTPSVEKAFQRRTPRYGSLARGRKRLGHAIERLPIFRERNPPDLVVPRGKPPGRAATLGQSSTPAGGPFPVWRDRPFYQIRPRRGRWRRLRSTRIALFFPPEFRPPPRYSPPLPGVQDRVIPDAELVTLGRGARERLLIRPIVRCASRPRPPLATEESGNLRSAGHHAVWPQALDRKAGMQC